MKKVAILGTGAWGTALANALGLSKCQVNMWGIDHKEVDDINKGYNKKYFSQKIDKNVSATLKIEEAIENAEFIFLAIPSKFLKEVLILNHDKFKNKPIFINVSKGLDPETNKPMSETLKAILKGCSSGIASLIGPSFAIDVMERKPTIINCVCHDKNVSQKVASLFNCNFFKVIEVQDEIGSEICGALKNLLAIGIGISHENHNSINTISALLTLGINEIGKIVLLQKGDEKTILQLCGIGDIFLTCTSSKSRNFSFGTQLYKLGLKKTLETNHNTVEGYTVYKIVENIIGKQKSEYPILWSICNVLNGTIKPKDFVKTCVNLVGLKEE